MRTRIVLGLWAGLAASLPLATALAADKLPARLELLVAEAGGQPVQENHTQEALKHAKAAAKSGFKGDASTIAEHAQLAKTHVEAALTQRPDNPHLKAALDNLNQAIAQGNLSMADPARQAAHEAVVHLKAAAQ